MSRYIVIDDVFIDKDIFKKFACNYSVCKGACCWTPTETSLGGELTNSEFSELLSKQSELIPYIKNRFLPRFKRKPFLFNNEKKYTNTKDSACVFSCISKKTCALKLAHKDGVISFDIPRECGDYPLKISFNTKVKIQVLHGWDHICKDAFIKGEKEDIPMFRFLQKSIIRDFGEEFYNKIEDAYRRI